MSQPSHALQRYDKSPTGQSVKPAATLWPAFTLVELLAATAIASVVTVLAVGILAQLFQASAEAANRLAVQGDVLVASQALARDINCAAAAVVADAHHLTLTQPDPEGGAARSVVYTVSPPLLLRQEGANAQAIARNIASGTAFAPTGVTTSTQMLRIQLVSALGQQTQSTSLQVALRPQP